MGVGGDGDGSGEQAEDSLCSVTVPACRKQCKQEPHRLLVAEYARVSPGNL